MNSSVIDLIIRIKNGYMARRETIETPHSLFRGEILKKLVKLKYVKGYKVKESGAKKTATIELLYADGVPAVTDVKIVSSPGRRWYTPKKDLKPVVGGLGSAILSSSKGILTDKEAKKENVGGELLFEIW